MHRTLPPQMLRRLVASGAHARLPQRQVVAAFSAAAPAQPAAGAWRILPGHGIPLCRPARRLSTSRPEADGAARAEEGARAAEEAARASDAGAAAGKEAEGKFPGAAADKEAEGTPSSKAPDEGADAGSKEAKGDGAEGQGAAAEAAAAEEAPPPETPETKLQKEVSRLEEEVVKKKKELLLALADFENVKKANLRERERRRRAATEEFARRMLEVYESFPAEAPRSGEAPKPSEQCQALEEGVGLTGQLMKSSLEKFGMKEVAVAVGDAFAGSHHEQVGSREAADGEAANTVVEVVAKGWVYEPDTSPPRVLRKAHVKVAVSP